VEIEARYVPVPVKLEPRESINSECFRYSAWFGVILYPVDQGILRVDLLEGKDIHAADRGGLCHVFLEIRSLT
jgi:hypothetical protein